MSAEIKVTDVDKDWLSIERGARGRRPNGGVVTVRAGGQAQDTVQVYLTREQMIDLGTWLIREAHT